MSALVRIRRLLSRRLSSPAIQNLWTPDNIVKSPYADIEMPNLTLHEYIWKDLNKWADKTAVVCGITNRSYTYENLYKYSQNFAATLRSQMDIKDGDVIGLMMPNSPEYPIAVIGCITAGAIISTINPTHTASEVQNQLFLSKPKVIMGSPETVGVIKEALNLTRNKIPIITVGKQPGIDLPSATIYFEEVINNDNVDKNILNTIKRRPEDVVLLPYSSGTTGLPKGVELTNRNEVFNFAQQEENEVRHYNETTSQHQDSILAVIPFYHIYGLSILLLHKLAIGAKIVVLPKFEPATFFKSLSEQKINLLYTAPPLVLFLGTHPNVKKEYLDSVDRLVCGAAPLSKSDIRRLLDKCQPHSKFIQIYGLTEVSPFATSMVPGSRDHTTVGFALSNTELRVVDANERNLGPDEVGELHIRGPHVMKGYRDNPEATKAAITDDGWFRSGDLVSINSDGAVTIIDRIKELIKVNGYQVAPAELEGLLKDHPDILDAAVIGIPDDRKGEVPKAFVILKEGHKTIATDVIDFINKKVAKYKRLQHVEFVDVLPKNASGKLLRQTLKKYTNNPIISQHNKV